MSVSAPIAPRATRLITPKECSAAIGSLRSARWFRGQGRLWIRSKGKRGLRCEVIGGDYFFDPAVLERFRPSLTELRFLLVS
jgi:hypothetical protein